MFSVNTTGICRLVVLCWLGLSGLAAQSLYEIDPAFPVHPLDSVLEVLADTAGTLDFAAAAASPNWRPLTEVRERYGAPRWGWHLPQGPAAYFARARLRSPRATDGWELHLENRLFGNVNWIRGNGLVEMQVYDSTGVDGRLLHKAMTGADAPPRSRDLAGNRILDRLRLRVPADTTVTLMLRLEGNAFGFPASLNANLRAPHYQHYHPYLPWRTAFNTFLLGVAFIMLLVHLLLYFYLGDRVYLWFAVWLLLCTLTQGMTIGIDIRDALPFYSPDFRFLAWLMVPGTMLYSFWLFGRAFIGTPRRYPRLDRFLIAVPAAMGVLLLVQIVRVVWFAPDRTFSMLPGYFETIGVIALASLALGVVLATRQDDRLARYFGAAATVASLFILGGALWSLRLLRLPADPYAVGMFSQIVLYSFGLAYRQQQIAQAAHREELAAQAARAEVDRLRDLDDIKARFFANISHEFRTPLSLISAPLRRARERTDQQNGSGTTQLSAREYDLVTQNTDRLTDLVEQLLELAQLENQTVMLQLRRGDIVAFLRQLVANFESLAERKGVTLVARFPQGCPTASFDADKVTKIVGNLVANAVKFTPARGTVTVSVDCKDTSFTVEVTDTGPGIKAADIDHIFERFYRIAGTEEKGSGIGLALTRELVDIYHGTITVRSTVGEGSTFRVRLPHAAPDLPPAVYVGSPTPPVQELGADAATAPPVNNGTETAAPATKPEKRPLLLIVEDNESLREFVAELLAEDHRVLTAVDGHQGERMATEHLPDLVISDVMMPGQDGYALCHALKTNPKTSHVPVILLTAKADRDATLAGLTQGADDYLTKPFDAKELHLRVRNLLDRRQRLWDHFLAQDLTLLPDVDARSLDEQFVQTVAATITQHLSDDQLSVDVLARAVGFSPSQLTRKLSALTGKTPNQLITEMRLHEAHRLLERGQGTVAEVAYRVGYAHPGYFSRRFKGAFGRTPSEVLGAGEQKKSV